MLNKKEYYCIQLDDGKEIKWLDYSSAVSYDLLVFDWSKVDMAKLFDTLDDAVSIVGRCRYLNKFPNCQYHIYKFISNNYIGKPCIEDEHFLVNENDCHDDDYIIVPNITIDTIRRRIVKTK